MKPADKTSPQLYAKIAGFLLFFSILGGAFGEAFIPEKLVVSNDATATANNILEFSSLFRLGFASYLIEAICDVSLILVLYLLLKPAGKNIARLSVLFGLVSTVTFACSELFYFMTLSILEGDYLAAFSPDQVNALARLSLGIYGNGAGIFMVFYGIASILRGYLIFKSGYLPKLLGILLAFAGTSFVIRNFVFVLAPEFASSLFYLPMPFAILTLTIWFFAKGVNIEKWKEKTAGSYV